MLCVFCLRREVQVDAHSPFHDIRVVGELKEVTSKVANLLFSLERHFDTRAALLSMMLLELWRYVYMQIKRCGVIFKCLIASSGLSLAL